MFIVSSKNETNKKKIPQLIYTFSIEDEDTEISNTDLDQSSDSNELSIIQLISSVLNGFINENEKKTVKNNSIGDTIFFCENIPKISIEDYLNRIRKYTEIEDSTLVIALIYIDRLLGKKHIKLSMNNVHKILLTAILLAVKYNEDEVYNNVCFAKIFGIRSKELNKLEKKFLDLIGFKLFTSKKEFQLYYNKI